MCKQYGNVDTPLVPVCIEHVSSGCKPGIVVRCVCGFCVTLMMEDLRFDYVYRNVFMGFLIVSM